MDSRKSVNTGSYQPRLWAPLDGVVVALTLALAVAWLPYFQTHGDATVVVSHDGTVLAEYPCDVDRVFLVSGSIGTMKIEVKNHAARVLESTCKGQICVRSLPVSRPGEQIVCAPNHVVVEIRSPHQGRNVDATTR